MESVKNYIEFRVYLKAEVTAEDIEEIAHHAEDLRDNICEEIAELDFPLLCGDVTYEVKFRDIPVVVFNDLINRITGKE